MMPETARRVLIGLGSGYAVLTLLLFLFPLAPGPAFPPSAELRVEAPRLTVPCSRTWRNTRDAVVVSVRDGRAVARTNFEPADGGPRVRVLDREADPPFSARGTRVALLMAADADEPWGAVLEAAIPCGGISHVVSRSGVFLAGRSGAVALVASPPKFDVLKFDVLSSVNFGLLDIAQVYPVPIHVVRVTRQADRVRYRWWIVRGVDDRAFRPGHVDRLEGVAMTARDVREGRVSPLAPLRERLREGARGALVLLQADEDARYVDVLRAVECAAGDERIQLWPCPWTLSYRELSRLEEVRTGYSDASVLLEEPLCDSDEDDALWVHVVLLAREYVRPRARFLPAVPPDDTSQIFVRKRLVTLDEIVRRIREERPAHVHLRPDTHVRWADCRPIVLAAQEFSHLRAAFAAEPGLPVLATRLLDLPVAPGPRRLLKMVRHGDSGWMPTWPLEDGVPRDGDRVSLRVPADARAGEVLGMVLGLRADGVVVVFE